MDKETISKYKKILSEAWKDPRKKAGIKLGGYLVFFLILFLVAGISNSIKSNKVVNPNNDEVTKDDLSKYNETFLNDKHTINYVITNLGVEYKINGTLDNSVINGYLESDEGIKKVIIKDNIYEIINDQENILDLGINNKLINIKEIFNMVNNNEYELVEEKENIYYNYSFNIDSIKYDISFNYNGKGLNKVSIDSNNINYVLNFDN